MIITNNFYKPETLNPQHMKKILLSFVVSLIAFATQNHFIRFRKAITRSLFLSLTILFTGKINAQSPGNALNFDGVDDYVSLSSEPVSGTNMTFEAWVYWQGGSNWQRIMDLGTGQGNNIFLTARSANGTLRFVINVNNAGEQMVETSALTTNQWHHVAVTINSGTWTMYVDGQQVAQTTGHTYTPSSVGATNNNWLGKSQYPDPYFNGMLDEVRFWSTARTLSQIQNDMGHAVSAGTAGLISYYNFNQGTAGGNNAGVTTLQDVNNAIPGTLNNFSLTGTTSNWTSSAAMTTISYSGSPFCQTGVQFVTRTGPSGGTYSASPAGLDIDANTGYIFPAPSTPGTYTVSYTVGGTVVATTSVTVLTKPKLTLLPTRPVCQGATSFLLHYVVTAGTPNSYSIALKSHDMPGFVPVNNAPLIESPLVVSIPGGATPGTYYFTITVTTPQGCKSAAYTFAVNIESASGAVGPITASYYKNADFQTFKYSEQVNYIGNDWGAGSPNSAVLGTDQFSIRYVSTFHAPVTGTYIFRTYTDDGARLWVNNQLLVDQWLDMGPTSYVGTLTLTAGQTVPVQMEYYENAGGAVAFLYYTTPGSGEALFQTTASTTIMYDQSSYCQTGVAFPHRTGGLPGGTYSASPGGLNINSSSGNISPASSTPGTYTVTYTTTTANGCALSASTVVTILPSPKVTLGSTTTICESGNPQTVSLPYTVTQGTPVSYNLTANNSSAMPGFVAVSNGTLSGGTIPVTVPANTPDGTYKFDLTVSSAEGCTLGKYEFPITIVGSNTTISYNSGQPLCQTGNVLPARTGAAGGTYSSTTGLSMNSTSGAIYPAASTPGTYTVTYTVTTPGCLYSTTTSVTIIATPKITLPSLTALCVGTGGSTASIPYNNVTAGTPATYNLMTAVTNPMPNFVPVMGAALTPNNISVNVPAGTPGGIYYFDLYVVTAEGCMSPKYVFGMKVLGPCPITSPIFTRTSIKNKKGTEDQLDNDIIIAPNPVHRMLNIQAFPGENTSIRVTTAEGKMLLQNVRFNSSYHFDMSGYAPGIYLVEVLNEKTGEIVRKKVVKE